MSAQHTPGPWYINTSEQLSDLAVCAKSRGEGWGSSVAVCTDRTGPKPLPVEEAQANARLIAAAPDLLAIAKRLAALSDGLNNGNSASEADACRLAEMARAVVAAVEVPA